MEETKIKISYPRQQLLIFIAILGAISLFVVAASMLDLELGKFISRFKEMPSVLKLFLAIDLTGLSEIIAQLFVSISMAIGSLIIGTVISLILAFVGASNMTPHPAISMVIKGSVSVIRAVPSLIWILIIIASLGFGNTSGLVGMILPTIGYLTKSFISSIEEQDDALIEAMKSTGASWLQIIFEGLIPSLVAQFMAWVAIRLEGNIAESISLGMVGAGGIGTVLMRAIAQYNYGRISVIILIIFITMVTTELMITNFKKQIR